MKKRTKIGLGCGLLLLGVVALSGCTSSFCTTNDKAHALYANDSGIAQYVNKSGAEKIVNDINDHLEEGTPKKNFEDVFKSTYTIPGVKINEDLYRYVSYDNSPVLARNIVTARDSGLVAPGSEMIADNGYFVVFEELVMDFTVKYFNRANPAWSKSGTDILFDTVEDMNKYLLANYGYIRFADFTIDEDTGEFLGDHNDGLMGNYYYFDKQTRKVISNPDLCPSTDFWTLHVATLYTAGSAVRTCLTTTNGYYGPTIVVDGVERGEYYIQGKTWGDAWQEGFFEGLLIYPIGAMVDGLWNSFHGNGMSLGWCSILAIFIATIVVRTIILAVSFKQTTGNAKMAELQPEITKIQNKYPNSKTNNYEKQRMAEEMQKLYKKNKINPFSTIIVLIVQFPVFICVWNAMSTSAALSTGSFAGLSLTATISNTLFNQAYWVVDSSGYIPGLTALLLFLLMAIGQTISMLLPQWIQKSKAKKVANLGVNPSKKSQDNKMKWFTYIMLAMIIIMGFTLASAMGVYWLVGAIFSIVQTLVTQLLTSRKRKKN